VSLFARALGIFGQKATMAAAPNDEDRQRLREQLQRDEGCRLHAYRDTEGFLTIGFGHNLDADPALRDRLAAQCGGDPAQIVIDRATAERLLDNDIAVAEDALYEALPWARTLDGPRRGVLINMAFNCGIGGLLGFRKMLAACQWGDWSTAAAEMLDSKWARQVGPRATRLAAQMREGVWV